MKIPIPDNNYIRKIDIQNDGLEVIFGEKKKIALLFISLNDRYWPYLAQVLKDCREKFLPQHKVDYFIWTDYSKEKRQKLTESIDVLLRNWKEAPLDQKVVYRNNILSTFAYAVKMYEPFFAKEISVLIQTLAQKGHFYKREGSQFWIESTREMNDDDVMFFINAMYQIVHLSFTQMDEALKGTTITETEGVSWPAPTLMRYHLFLQQENLKDYDYVFYLDADMKIVSVIGDEILNDGIMAAEHPMYSLKPQFVPPYEPNKDSTAYIKRPGRVIDDQGKPRFKPYYYAGGFQGGKSKPFIKAMETMKKNIDKDFNNNYTAIWNDESHWNKYLSEYDGDLVVMSPSYVYPDSLIKEYYIPLWGKEYEPKIITLTKPFSISEEGGKQLNELLKK